MKLVAGVFLKEASMSGFMTRRQVLISGIKIATAIAPTSLLFGCGKENTSQPSPLAVEPVQSVVGLDTRLHRELIDSSKSASMGGQWTELEFNELIDAMGEDSLKRICKTLNISPVSIEQYSSNALMKKEIKKTILWASRTLPLPGGDPDEIRYHEKVLRPTAQHMELDEINIATYDTLSLERAIYNKAFEQSWTSLNENERINFLKQSGWQIEEEKIISLAALTGTGVIAGISTTVKIIGFPFYIGMSNGMFALASSLGFTLPFSAYMGASTAIALATGPIGWITAAVLAGTGIYAWMTGNDSSEKEMLLKAVLQIHHYKISAMQEAGIEIPLNGI